MTQPDPLPWLNCLATATSDALVRSAIGRVRNVVSSRLHSDKVDADVDLIVAKLFPRVVDIPLIGDYVHDDMSTYVREQWLDADLRAENMEFVNTGRLILSLVVSHEVRCGMLGGDQLLWLCCKLARSAVAMECAMVDNLASFIRWLGHVAVPGYGLGANDFELPEIVVQGVYWAAITRRAANSLLLNSNQSLSSCEHASESLRSTSNAIAAQLLDESQAQSAANLASIVRKQTPPPADSTRKHGP